MDVARFEVKPFLDAECPPPSFQFRKHAMGARDGGEEAHDGWHFSRCLYCLCLGSSCLHFHPQLAETTTPRWGRVGERAELARRQAGSCMADFEG